MSAPDAGPRLLRAALAYAERGWFIFPLLPRSKDPLTPHGFKDASRNPEHVRRWWTATPGANLGLWPGPSGLVVVDGDGPVGEATLTARGLTAEPTLTVVTGRADGGRHLYFAGPTTPIEATTLGPGTTVRHFKGYVVAPPSVHPETGATYRWAGQVTDLRALPAAVLDALRAPAPSPALGAAGSLVP
jgi:bifunctional DNA primase/polymerase-like protein